MFERYTESANRVLLFSHQEARALGSALIRSEHILLGVIRSADGVASPILAKAGLSTDAVKSEMPAPKPRIPDSIGIQLHQESKRVIQYASEEADRLLHNYLLARPHPTVWTGSPPLDDSIGPEHLLLGLLREDKAEAASILARHGVTLEAARDEVAQQAQRGTSE
jgi:ATP-dependent Clp protease ATP-binding subunit ClpC